MKKREKRTGIFPRRYPRLQTNIPIQFNIMKFQKRNLTHLMGKKGLGICRDIGEDGLSFISNLSLPLGMLLRVTLPFPDEGEERMLARVLRCIPFEDRYLTAVQFFNFNGHRREKIRSFLTEEAKKNYNFVQYL